MLEKLIHAISGNRHRFRHMTFDELSELYTSMMLRSLAMSMAGIFIPIYLYQHHYEIWQIFLFYLIALIAQLICVFPIAKLIGRIGPKHTILLSYFFQIANMFGLIFIDKLHPAIVIPIVFGIANVLFFSAFHTDFSKVKHSAHGGSEIGWLYIMERVGAVLGPLVGGLVAYLFAPEYTFAVSIFLLLIASLPLFMTNEPVRLHQKLDFKKLKLKDIKSDLLSYGFFSVEVPVSVVVWPLFAGVIVFKDNPYIQLGSILSISVVLSIVLARMIGKTVDNKQGRRLLRLNASLNALLHAFRAFTNGYPMALAINIVNEGVTAGYRMPYMKGMYDAADDHPGSRIVYIAVMEATSMSFRIIFFTFAMILAYFMSGRGLFTVLFLVGTLVSLLIMLERFPALNPKNHVWSKK